MTSFSMPPLSPSIWPQYNLLCLTAHPPQHETLWAALQQSGCTLSLITSPEQAQSVIESNPPTLVVIDTVSAAIDMYDLAQALKTVAGLEDTPFIVLADRSLETDKARAYALGVVAFLVEPILPQEILTHLERHAQTEALYLELLAEAEKFHNLSSPSGLLSLQLDDFVGTIAHNIRNPLGAVISYAEYLKKFGGTMSTADIAKDLNVIASNGHRVNRIIDELRLLIKIRTAPPTPEPLDMITIIFKVQERLEKLIETYQAEIVLAPIWPEALGMYDWIEEVWVNYLGNALKHGGRPPRVELGSRVQPDGMIEFWIHDNGRGLTFTEEATIFPDFTHFSQAKVKGDGMGLALVRYIVEKLGGQVKVESAGTARNGTTFSFSLPPSKVAYRLEDDL